ncbi:MAG: YHYH protein [Bacteroidota bacterium]
MKITSIWALSLSTIILSCNSGKNSTSTIAKTKQDTPASQIDFLKEYRLTSAEFGSQTTVSVSNTMRIMRTNALPNHATGTFPNEGNPNTISAQNKQYTFPLKPKFSGESKWAREPGIAVNGVKFEPETAERFICESGEVYKIEAIQDLVDLGLDHNHAHVQPTGAYHYHGAPTGLIKQLDKGEDIILIGFAKDGFPMYYSKSGKYKPSYVLSEAIRTGEICGYRNPKQHIEQSLSNTHPDGTFVSDWTYVPGQGQLDECNGIEHNGQYAYFVTDEYPYVGRCLKGVFSEKHPPHGRPPGRPHHHGPSSARN